MFFLRLIASHIINVNLHSKARNDDISMIEVQMSGLGERCKLSKRRAEALDLNFDASQSKIQHFINITHQNWQAESWVCMLKIWDSILGARNFFRREVVS